MATQPNNPIVRVAQQDTILPSTQLDNKILPSTSVINVGYDANELVAAENLNYIFDNLGKWLTYLLDIKNETNIQGGEGINITAGQLGQVIQVAIDESVARTVTKILAGGGLTGGGDLSEDRTLNMGTPSTLNGSTPNQVTGDTHTHNLDMATTADAISGVSTTKLMSPKTVHDTIPSLFTPPLVNSSTQSFTLPNGLIIKTAFIPPTGTPITITFNEPFPNGILGLTVSTNSEESNFIESYYSNPTANGFVFRTGENQTRAGSYIAIGY